MTTFDFTNVTFSGLLSILAALYGVGYPLIMQSIGRINSKYDSALLSERFLREPVYRWFQIAITLNLVFAVVAPFLLSFTTGCVLIITFVQTSFLAGLIYIVHKLLQTIIVYENGEKLLCHLTSNGVDDKNVKEIFDLLVYADIKNGQRLYASCIYKVYEYIREYGCIEKTEEDIDGSPLVNYHDSLMEVIEQWRVVIRGNATSQMLSKDTNIIRELLIAGTDKKRGLGIRTSGVIWELLQTAVANRNELFVRNFWETANIYYKVTYASLPEEIRSIFIQWCMALGGMIAYYERYSWLEFLLFGDKYTLTQEIFPSAYRDVMLQITRIDPDFSPFIAQHRIRFTDPAGTFEGTDTIFDSILQFSAILIIATQNVYSTWDLIPEEEVRDTNGYGNRLTSRTMNKLESCVSYVYVHDIHKQIPRISWTEKKSTTILFDISQPILFKDTDW